MRNTVLQNKAYEASHRLKSLLGITEAPAIGIVLGTGWGDTLTLEGLKEVPFQEIPGFENIQKLEGHARKIAYGLLNGVPVIALRGRLHLNEEPHSRQLADMVRLQVEMLLQLGVETLILTCAAGALTNEPGGWPHVGNIVVVDEFIGAFAPTMPLMASEFYSPNMALDKDLRAIAVHEAYGSGISALTGKHAMLRGPFFEGVTDKKILAFFGCSAVGMSMLPEACVAALYPCVKVLGLAFITNPMTMEHSHEENQAEARRYASKLGAYIGRIVRRIASKEEGT